MCLLRIYKWKWVAAGTGGWQSLAQERAYTRCQLNHLFLKT